MALRGLLIWVALGSVAWAADPVPAVKAEPSPTPKQQRRLAATDAALSAPEMETVRKAVEALTPEQRQRFQQNFQRWMNLSPDEKKLLRDKEEMRKLRVSEETAKAQKDLGLELTSEQQEKFAQRYAEERRTIEEKLRREMDEKRRPLLRELSARLREEFGAPAVVGATPIAKP